MNDTTNVQAPGAPTGTAIDPLLRIFRLSDLKPGNELKTGNINARAAGPDEDAVKAMKASIEEVGIVVPLVVTSHETGIYVIDGNTRLEALRQIYPKKEWPVVQVPAFEPPSNGSLAEGLELSLIANIERTDLHPVDEFEVFERLTKAGATLEQIGRRYRMKPTQVRQALALARLHPDVRAAWRAGKIEAETAEAFGQTQDLAHQASVLKKLGKSGGAWHVNQAIVGGHNEFNVSQMLKFVGKAAYEDAGHDINESLFGEDDRDGVMVANVPALRAMTNAKLDAECNRLVEDGWGWAIVKSKAPTDMYSWRRLPVSNPAKDLKANAGCTVGIEHNGTLDVQRGYIKPGVAVKIPKTAKQKAEQAKSAKTKAESGGLSQSLCFRLSQAITTAAAKTIAMQPDLALRAVVASMMCSGVPVRIELHGHDAEAETARHDQDPAKVLASVIKLDDGELMEELATWAGVAMQMVAHSPQSMPLFAGKDADEDQKASALLLDAMNADALNNQLRAAFDRKDYFASVPAALIAQALVDCGHQDQLSAMAKLKKAGKIAFALDHVGDKWLPPEMRTANYDGPVASPAKAAPKASGKKAPAKSKKKKGGK